MSKIQKNALKDPKYDLAAMLLNGQRDEQSNYQSKVIESSVGHSDVCREETNKVEPEKTSNKCFNCGGIHCYGNCLAKGKQCGKCKTMNHFVKVCRSKKPQ